MTTPIMALLQFAFYSARFSKPILACLAVVCAGCIFATATEIQLTLTGFSIALAACTVTAIYSIVRCREGTPKRGCCHVSACLFMYV